MRESRCRCIRPKPRVLTSAKLLTSSLAGFFNGRHSCSVHPVQIDKPSDRAPPAENRRRPAFVRAEEEHARQRREADPVDIDARKDRRLNVKHRFPAWSYVEA